MSGELARDQVTDSCIFKLRCPGGAGWESVCKTDGCDWSELDGPGKFCETLRGGLFEPGHELSRGPCLWNVPS